MMSSIILDDVSPHLHIEQCGENQTSLRTSIIKISLFSFKCYSAIISNKNANRKQEPHKKYQKYGARITDQVSQAEFEKLSNTSPKPAVTQKYFKDIAYPKTSPLQSLNEYDGLKINYQTAKNINTEDTGDTEETPKRHRNIDAIRRTSLGSTDKAAPSHPEDVGLGKSAEEDATTSKDHTEDVQTESADDQMPSSSKAPKDTECSGGAYHDGDAAPASASELPVSEMGSRGDARTSPMQFRQNASTTLTEINPPGMTREENATPMDSKSSLKEKSSYSATPPLSSSVCSVNDQPPAGMPDVNSEEAYSKWSQMTGAVENDGLSASVPPSSLQTDLKGIPSMITPEHCKMTLTEQSRCDKETTHLEKHATFTPAGETRSSKTSVPVLTTPSNTETQVKDNGLLVESRKSVSQTPMDDCATFSALDKDSDKLLFQRPGTGNNKTLSIPEENSDAGLKQNCDGDATEVKSAVTTKELTIPKEPPPQNQTNDDQQMQVLRKTSQGLERVKIVLSAKDDAYFEGEYSKAMSLKHVACASILASDFYQRVQQAFPFQQFNGRERSRWEFWRLSTFAPLDNFPVSPIRLAQSGFYYDEVLDDIICFSCGLRKRQWDITEKSVAVKHLELSEGNCAQANFQDERNVPIDSARFPRVSSPANTEHPQRRADSSQGRGESLSTDVSDARGFSEAPSSSSSCPPSLETAEHRAAVTGERHSHVGDLPPAPGKTHADRVMSPQGRNNQQERGYAEVNGNALRTNVSSLVESGSNSLARHTQQTSSQATATNTQNGIASPPSDRPEQNYIADTSPPLDRPQQNSIAGTSPPSDIPQQNSIADTSPPSDRPQQNSIADTLPLTHPPQQNGIADKSPPSDRPQQNSTAGTSPPSDRPQQNSIADTSPPSDRPQQNSIADTSPPSDRPQQNSTAGTSPPSDRPQQNSTAGTSPPSDRPQQNSIAGTSPPSDRPQKNSIVSTSPPSDRPQQNSGTTYSLPPPLPRTEEIEKHRRLAAHSAGRAQCQSSLLPLSSSNRESDTPGRISVSATTSQAPSAFNTPATTELRHYPVQDEQGPNLTPDQISAFVPPRGDGLANGSTRRNGDGADGDESAINGLDMTRAVSPGNASASARLASFTDWPTRGLPSPRLLVIAGFYYLGT